MEFWLLTRMRIVQEKKYTEEHEWIELSEDGKIGNPTPSLLNSSCPTH